MAKCKTCGRKGLFLAVNKYGECAKCDVKPEPHITKWTLNMAPASVATETYEKPSDDELEKRLLESEKTCDDIIDLHFIYNQLIELTYRKRSDNSYYNRCIYYCMKDVGMFPKFREAWFKKYPTYIDEEGNLDIIIPSFERLAIISEKQGNIEGAINICEWAIHYKLRSKTQSGFEGRLEKLKRKL